MDFIENVPISAKQMANLRETVGCNQMEGYYENWFMTSIPAETFDVTSLSCVYKMTPDDYGKLDGKQWLSHRSIIPVEIITIDPKDVMSTKNLSIQ